MVLFDAELLPVTGDHCHHKLGPALEEHVISNVPVWPAEDKYPGHKAPCKKKILIKLHVNNNHLWIKGTIPFSHIDNTKE